MAVEQKSYLKKLQEQVEALQDGIDGRDLQIVVVQDELLDVTLPSRACSETTMYLLQMLSEILLYVSKKGWTDATKSSFKRLKRLMDLNKIIDDRCMSNYNLKMTNKNLHTEYQLLRIRYRELRIQVENMAKSENF